jgi:DNA processing protein
VVTSLLDLALLGLNPERVRRILAGPPSAVRAIVGTGGVGSIPWPADGVEFVEGAASPDRLRVLPDAPPWLFVKGRIPEGPMVAVVGSRRATRYGLEIAAEIGRRLGSAGWPVVSGLALGVDAAAHQGCLEAGGRAVAVLGSGIDVWYPRKNRALGERILIEGGAVISEFGPGVTPEPWRFPFRNRIISGLASVVIVVEAAVRSGALITAHLAIGYGREVMAVPGDIDRSTSVGCNLLIRDGAHPITGLDDLVETIEFWLGPAPCASVRSEPGALGRLPATIDQIAQRRGVGTTDLMLEIMRMQSAGTIIVEEGVVRQPTTATRTGSHDYGR